MRMSETLSSLSSALSNFQAEVRNPANTATNPQFRSKYAPLDVVINTVKPILAKNGLSFIQSTGAEGENIVITTLLLHSSGEWIESDPLTLPAYQIKKGNEKEFNAQGAGSAITYGRRYSLSAMLGLSSEDDDDGNVASGGYKDASNNTSSTNTQANSNAEKKRQETIARAQSRSNANTSTTQQQSTPSTGGKKIEEGQLKAIDNMINLIGRKKEAFDKDSHLAKELGEYGVGSLDELSFEQGKELIGKLNAFYRS